MAKVNITPKRTSFQKFVVEEIERVRIANAPYNPRRITDDARARLKAKIKTVGLVNVLVWNRRTGNLVSGHQRLSILDELEGNLSYSLKVSVVDIEAREEKELNVFLNNDSTMGEWDSVALKALAAEFKDDLSGFGFAPGELDHLTDKLDEPPPDKEGEGENGPRETQDGTQVVVVFRDAAETEEFLRFLGVSLDSRYVDAGKLFARRGFAVET